MLQLYQLLQQLSHGDTLESRRALLAVGPGYCSGGSGRSMMAVAQDKYSSEHSSSKLKCRRKERKRSEAINQDAVARSEIGKDKRRSSIEYKDSAPKEYARDSRKVYESKPQIYHEGKPDTYHSDKRKRTHDSIHSHHQDEKRMKYDKASPDTYNYEEAYEEYKPDNPDRKRLCHKHKNEKPSAYEEPKRYDKQNRETAFETKHGHLEEMHTNDYVSKPNDKVNYYEEASSYDEAKLELSSDIEQEGIRERDEAIADVKEPRQRDVIELNPMVAKIVEDELRDVMIKVWQSLPDNPTGPAEELVVDQLNKQAGDDLRNTLGLNITQRMLDVNNQFILLIDMSSSDYKTSDRIEFAKKHRLSHFNRLRLNVFQARVKQWDDYEKFFKPRRWICGKASCRIKPLFDFTRWPDNVKTVYDGSQEYSEAKKLEKEAASKLKQLAKPVLTADQVLAKSKTSTTKTADKKTVRTKTNKIGSAKKNVTPKITKTVTAKDVLSKPTNSVKSENTSKDVAKTTDSKTTGTPSKTVVKKPVTPAKDEPLTKKSDETKEKSTQLIVKKPVPNAEANKPETKAAEDAKNIAKPVAKVAAATEKEVVKEVSAIISKPTKTTPTKVLKAVTKAPAKTVANETAKSVGSDSAKPVTPSTTAATIPAKTIAKIPLKMTTDKPATPMAKDSAISGTAIATETAKTLATVPSKVVAKDPAKSAATAATVAKKTVAKAPAKTTASAPVVKQSAKLVKVAKPIVNTLKESKTQIKTNPKSISTPVKSPVKTAKENDFDELDDNGILCMLSGGIILDECSGSDDD